MLAQKTPFNRASPRSLRVCNRSLGTLTPSSPHDPLLDAAKQNDLEAVEQCLKQQSDPNSCDRQGTTALMFAASRGAVHLIQRLLQAGARVDQQRETFGVTALMLAAANHQREAVVALS